MSEEAQRETHNGVAHEREGGRERGREGGRERWGGTQLCEAVREEVRQEGWIGSSAVPALTCDTRLVCAGMT